MAEMAACTEGETETHLGLQDPLPGCPVSTACEKDHICGCRPGIVQTAPTYSLTI